MSPLVIGTLLAIAALLFVLYPLLIGANPGPVEKKQEHPPAGCANCGQPAQPNGKFCTNCGRAL